MTFGLRTVPAGDSGHAAYVRRLHLEDLRVRLAGLPAAILEQQAEIRARQYADHYPRALDRVIEIDGRPVGRILVAERPEELRVVDLAVAVADRGRGAATHALRQCLAEGDDRGLAVGLCVDPHNPALRLYRRLGFEPVHHDPTTVHLRCLPGRKAHA